MEFRPLSGRGAAVVRWVPLASDDVNLRPFLVTLLYARILTAHKETRAYLFSLIGELSRHNVRDEGATGFVFPEWTLSVPGVPPQRIWPWDLSQDIASSSAAKMYIATLQAFEPKGRAYFGIHLKMAFGLERVLAPASALLAIDSYLKSTDREGCYELAVLLWQVNEFYGAPDNVRLGQEKAALAAAMEALRGGNLRAPS